MSQSNYGNTNRIANPDDFAFFIPPENRLTVVMKREQLAAQIVAELAVQTVTDDVIGVVLRERDPLSDTYHAAGQFVCLSVAMDADRLGVPTSRVAVANRATMLSGRDFSGLASAVIHRAGTGTAAIDLANMRLTKTRGIDIALPVLALAEDFSLARSIIGNLPTGEPADYSRIRDELLPPLPSSDDPILAGIFAA